MEALQWNTANDDFTLIREMPFGEKIKHHRMLRPCCGKRNRHGIVSAYVDGYLVQVIKT